MSEKNIKAILAILVLLVAFSILLIFQNNQTTLLQPSVFPVFMTLSTVGLALLVGLLYLVNRPFMAKVKIKAKKSVHSSKKKKR